MPDEVRPYAPPGVDPSLRFDVRCISDVTYDRRHALGPDARQNCDRYSPRRREIGQSGAVMRWIARVVGGVMVVLLVIALVAAGLSARDYGTPSFWAAPDRVNYCGRRYYRDARAHRAK